MNQNEVFNSAHISNKICIHSDLFQNYTLEILMTICFILGFLTHKYCLKQIKTKDNDNIDSLNEVIPQKERFGNNYLEDDMLNF